MTPWNTKYSFAVGWIVVILSAAALAGVASVGAWIMVSLVAFGPSIARVYFSQAPAQTTSESIQNAKR